MQAPNVSDDLGSLIVIVGQGNCLSGKLPSGQLDFFAEAFHSQNNEYVTDDELADYERTSFLANFDVDDEPLGRGAQGIVRRAALRNSAQCTNPGVNEFVLKEIRLRSMASKDSLMRAKREAEVLSKLDHENIVKIFTMRNIRDQFLFLQMEYCVGGNLRTAIRDQKLTSTHFDEMSQIRPWFEQMSNAVNYLHSKNIIHRDIKPENMVFKDLLHTAIKLIDFGLAKEINDLMQEKNGEELQLLGKDQTSTGRYQQATTVLRIGTCLYMAPEILGAGKPPDSYSDVWALGVVLFELATLQLPFQGRDLVQLSANVASDEVDESMLEARSPVLRYMVKRILNKKADKRPSIGEVLLPMWWLYEKSITSISDQSESNHESITVMIDTDLSELKLINGIDETRKNYNVCLEKEASHQKVGKAEKETGNKLGSNHHPFIKLCDRQMYCFFGIIFLILGLIAVLAVYLSMIY